MGIIAFQDLKQRQQPTKESEKVWAVGQGKEEEEEEGVISGSCAVVFQRREESIGSDATEKSDEDRKLTFSFVRI